MLVITVLYTKFLVIIDVVEFFSSRMKAVGDTSAKDVVGNTGILIVDP